MKRILLLIITISLIASCNKFLDVKPKGKTIPEYFQDYQNLMNDAQLNKAGGKTFPWLTDDVYVSDDPEIPFSFNKLTDDAKNLYSFKHGDVYGFGIDDSYWNFAYRRIFTFNCIINQVMNVKDAPEKDKKDLRAQALVARAFDYFVLVNSYGRVYTPATAETDYGVPYLTSEDLNDMKSYTRSSVAEVYRKIEADLKDAEPSLLPENANHYRATRTTVLYFFARLYFMKGEYDKALTYAQQALQVSENLVDMKLYTTNNKTSGRIILASDSSQIYPDQNDNVENNYIRYIPYVFGISKSAYASTELLDLYKKDLAAGAQDMRMRLWFVKDYFQGVGSFPGLYLYVPDVKFNIGFNNPDNMLMAAECYARKGDGASLTSAARLYNKLRDSRIKNNTHITFANADVAMEKILDERRREFAICGTCRYFDLRRLNRESKYAKTITHKANRLTVTLPPNDNRYIFPIPAQVKNFHPELPDYER